MFLTIVFKGLKKSVVTVYREMTLHTPYFVPVKIMATTCCIVNDNFSEEQHTKF